MSTGLWPRQQRRKQYSKEPQCFNQSDPSSIVQSSARPEVTPVYIRCPKGEKIAKSSIPISIKEQSRDRDEILSSEEEIVNEEKNLDVIPYERDLDRPITLRKGVQSCQSQVKYPLGQYVSYDKLGTQYKSFVSTLTSITIPRNVDEALGSEEWKRVMDEEIEALKRNET